MRYLRRFILCICATEDASCSHDAVEQDRREWTAIEASKDVVTTWSSMSNVVFVPKDVRKSSGQMTGLRFGYTIGGVGSFDMNLGILLCLTMV